MGWGKIVVAGALLLAAGAARGEDLSRDDEALLAWFDGLGFPGLDARPWVRASTGSLDAAGREEVVEGLLVAESGRDFQVMMLDLSVRSFTRKDEKPRVVFEKLDLAKSVQARLAEIRKPRKKDVPELRGEMLSERGQLVVLARACKGNGLRALAHEALVEAAKTLPPSYSLREAAAEDLSTTMIWRNTLAFADPGTSWRKLRDDWKRFVALFPEGKHAEVSKTTLAVLEKMVAEEEAHAKVNADALEGDALAKELVFQLREQNGRQFSEPGEASIHGDPRGEKSAAARLEKLGFAAVPALIAALEDERLTRTVECHRSFYFSHRVLTVGDCAAILLRSIAHRGFDEEGKSLKEQVEAWWSELQKKGEKQLLIEGTLAGNSEEAERLVEKYPEAALEAIRNALPATKGNARASLIGVLAKVKGDAPVAILVEEAAGSDLDVVLAAAQALMERGRPEGLAALLREWKALSAPDAKPVPANALDDASRSWAIERLVALLGTSDDATAIAALGEGFSGRPVVLRMQVVESLGASADKKAARQAVEAILLAALADNERAPVTKGLEKGVVSRPRIADLAALRLSESWKTTYEFDILAAQRDRDLAIVKIQNVARRARGEKPLVVPVLKRVAAGPVEDTRPLLEKLEKGNAKQRAAAQAELEGLSLAALPAVLERAAKLEGEPKAVFGKVASGLAAHVLEVVVEPGSRELPASLRKVLDASVGKRLTGASFAELLRAFSKVRGRSTLVAERGKDEGLTLRVTIETSSEQGIAEYVAVGSRPLASQSSFGLLADTSFSELVPTIDDALAAPVPSRLEVSVSVSR